MDTSLVITTINKPNKNILSFDKNCKKKNWLFIVIGDKKTPKNFKLKYGKYYSVNDQKFLNFAFAKKCLFNNYARKNIGYLISFKKRKKTILETDDDNYPYKKFFDDKYKTKRAKIIKNRDKWINIYKLFMKNKIVCWPRGIPLNKIHNIKINFSQSKNDKFFLQQGVCEGNPDVDAIFRLINKKINIKFKKNFEVNTNKSFVTLNSQNTIWFSEAFPLMYLPVTCTMRCTDIWRGLIAQRILQNDSKKILFFGTTMKQNRNDHNLISDFRQEIPMYLFNQKIQNILLKLKLKKGIDNYLDNLNICYESLIKKNIISENEKSFLKAWTKDYEKIY